MHICAAYTYLALLCKLYCLSKKQSLVISNATDQLIARWPVEEKPLFTVYCIIGHPHKLQAASTTALWGLLTLKLSLWYMECSPCCVDLSGEESILSERWTL
jgi:hypothetical protein